jgi:hypothetical protein
MYRIPSSGDKVRLQGLASAGDLNGETGKVLRYVKEQMRYQVKLTSIDRKGTVSIKVENLVLVETEKRTLKDLSVDSMHILIPCHVADEQRVYQFTQCVKSVSMQTDTNCCAIVGVSSPNQGMRYLIHGLLCALNDKRPGIRWYVLVTDSDDNKSQFEHFRDLLMHISDPIDKDAWLLFLDNDDMFHPRRVELFRREAARKTARDPDRIVFNCGDKLVLNSDIIGHNEVNFDEFVLKGDADYSEPWRDDEALIQVTQLATGPNVDLFDVSEYFDFCVRASVLRRFLRITPPQILAHKYCDVRFLVTVSRECVTRLIDRRYEWLLIHFRVPSEKKREAGYGANEGSNAKHSSASIDAATEDDMLLAKQTSLPPELVAACREELEEQIIVFLARDDRNLESVRDRFENKLNTSFGHSLGTILWKRVCATFSSYFTDASLRQNQDWCKEGRAPWRLLNCRATDDEY